MVHVKLASAEKWESFPSLSFLEELPIRVRFPFKLRSGTYLPSWRNVKNLLGKEGRDLLQQKQNGTVFMHATIHQLHSAYQNVNPRPITHL